MSGRLDIIRNHIASRFPRQDFDPSLENYRAKSSTLNKELILRHFIGPPYPSYKSLRSFLKTLPIFDHSQDSQLSVQDLRSRTLQQIAEVYPNFSLSYESDQSDPVAKFNILYALAEYDMGLCTRLIVTLILYLDVLTVLGTEKHRVYLDRGYELKDYGCLALTELGHGSEVASIETTATYDKTTHEFVIHSPSPTSAKWWIGAAAQTANMSVVYAQLIVNGKNQGIHVFIVPIRDSRHGMIPGVFLGDCGGKAGMNSVDDGYIIFRQHRVPYDCLLDRYSQITEKSGNFTSSITSRDKRLGVMFGGIIRGRLAVISGCECNLKCGLAIAMRYSVLRKQFSNGQGPELPIISYQTQKIRLIPILAQTFAIRAGALYLYNIYRTARNMFLEQPDCEELHEFHAILSCYKAISSWYGVQGLQVCREACGGLGYSAFSGIGRLRANQDANVTWEGENTVLLQQTSKYILRQVQRATEALKNQSTTLKFLRVNQKNVVKPMIKSGDSLEKEEILLAMEAKINYLLHQSISKLQENAELSANATEAWNNTQVFYLSDLARSFGEYLMIKQLYEMAGQIEVECKVTGAPMVKLARLYGASVLDKSLSVLYEAGMDSSGGKVIKDCVVNLSEELAEAALGIIEAIAPEDNCLGSTIGSSDGQAVANVIRAVEAHPNVYKIPDWLPILQKIRFR